MAELTISGDTHPILKDDYASEWMGIEVVALDDGHATIRMTLRQEMLNGFGMAHGGMIFAFGDTAFALACNPASPKPGEAGIDTDTITVASGVDINFLKPAFRGQVLTAVANRRASTGRSGLYDIQIYAADPGTGATAAPQSAPAGPAPAATVPGELPTDIAPGELIAEFRGRSRTISKK
ncbi:acyl-CoA thioesterase [Arthrobacter sp. ok909]|uniref:hotdog fold thioesterase n=1 Tax=Arthrobacter sp. ok909 TaxID=1761746 RepID=UPI00088AFA24|nr:hotdog fold thioesterase [Arthrobacter sp. ok909]SDP24619.1 acyl-CoA thioesterase [Arthrobacter sp. ok909]